MVRGPAALLGLIAVGWVYFLIPDQLPALHPEKLSIVVAASIGTAIIVLIAGGIAGLQDTPYLAPLVLLGAGLVAGALNAGDAGAAATVPETVAYAAAGVIFGWLLDTPALVLAVPLFIAGIDVISLLGGPSHTLSTGMTQPGDPLSLELPDWNIGLPAARLGLADIVFVGVFATYARRFGLRVGLSIAGMAVGLVAGLVTFVLTGRTMPELPFLAAGFLLPNLDRVIALQREPAE